MNAKKWTTGLINRLSRILAVIILVGVAVPAASQSAASSSSYEIPDLPERATLVAPSPGMHIFAGSGYTCAITLAGGVVCWGINTWGQLGDGTTNQSAVPVAVRGLSSGVMSLSLGGNRTCALTTFGQVYCWGYRPESNTISLLPELIGGLGRQVVQLSVGSFHVCVLDASGKVSCWGLNYYGQLGNGTFTDSPTPVVAIAADAVKITSTWTTSCAVMTNGEALCWGDGHYGQLGNNRWINSNIPVRVQLENTSPLTGVSQVGLGSSFGCALVGSGVQCWGTQQAGQLGRGTVDSMYPFASPVLMALGGPALSGADQIAVGDIHTCAHLSNGRVQCWGHGGYGTLGNGGNAEATLPVYVLNPAGTAPFEGATQVAASDRTCAFTDWESAEPFYCWGYNAEGLLGVGTLNLVEPLPRPVLDLSGVSGGAALEPHIVAGGAHTCSATTGGGLKCWGSNTHGQLGDGSTTDSADPLEVAGLSSGVKSMALGDNFTCAVISWGRLKCWGENTHGQLGDGSHTGSPLPLTVNLSGRSVQQAATGAGHTCVLTQAGSVLCWGDNNYGQLGDGTTAESSTPVTVTLGSSAVWIAAGGSTSCAVLSGGGVKCWGLGDSGQLGDASSGTGHHQSTAADVQVVASGVLTGTTQVALGSNFACALLAGGLVDCWGKNDWGQVGQGTNSPGMWTYATPVLAELGGSPLQGVKQITAGGAHACVRMYTNRLKCWGLGEVGQLGVGSSGSGVYSALPLTVIDHYQPYGGSIPYLEVVSQVSAGGAHTCAFLKWDGSNPYRCWGDNSSGQLGDGGESRARQSGARSLSDFRPYPTLVGDLLKFGSPPLAKIAGGSAFTCALTLAGSVKCWGANDGGQLGNGSFAESDTPVGVVGLSSGVVGLAAGGHFACALTSEGGVKCWGWNDFGQLGNNTNTTSNVPVDVIGLAGGIVELAAGRHHACALTSAGGVKCWGSNELGQLGDNTYTTSNHPVNVVGLGSEVIGLSLAGQHSCTLTSVGGVKCWGYNGFGQLGNGTNINSSTPVDVTTLAGGVVSLAAGERHTCALTSVGGVKCWGDNLFGQIGDGTFGQPGDVTNGNRRTPVDVVGLGSEVTDLSLGAYHSCALISAGGVKCWGENNKGQLGDSTFTKRPAPVDVSGLVGSATSLASGGIHTCAVLAGTGPLRCWGDNSVGQFGNGNKDSSNVPVDSKWLTSDGLVEDQKGEVIILPSWSGTLVVPAQPLSTTLLITVTEGITIPAPCTNCVVPADVLALSFLDDKPEIPWSAFLRWGYHSSSWLSQPSSRQSAVNGLDERYLNLFHYVNGTWVPMLPCTGCSLDTTNHVLTATLDGLGIYAIMVQRPPSFVYLPLVRRQ